MVLQLLFVESILLSSLKEVEIFEKFSRYGEVMWSMMWVTARQNQENDVRPAKPQISLGICQGWLGSSLSALWVAKDQMLLHSKESDQTGQMPRLIWIFAWRTDHFVGFVMHWLIFSYQERAYFVQQEKSSRVFQ